MNRTYVIAIALLIFGIMMASTSVLACEPGDPGCNSGGEDGGSNFFFNPCIPPPQTMDCEPGDPGCNCGEECGGG